MWAYYIAVLFWDQSFDRLEEYLEELHKLEAEVEDGT